MEKSLSWPIATKRSEFQKLGRPETEKTKVGQSNALGKPASQTRRRKSGILCYFDLLPLRRKDIPLFSWAKINKYYYFDRDCFRLLCPDSSLLVPVISNSNNPSLAHCKSWKKCAAYTSTVHTEEYDTRKPIMHIDFNMLDECGWQVNFDSNGWKPKESPESLWHRLLCS